MNLGFCRWPLLPFEERPTAWVLVSDGCKRAAWGVQLLGIHSPVIFGIVHRSRCNFLSQHGKSKIGRCWATVFVWLRGWHSSCSDQAAIVRLKIVWVKPTPSPADTPPVVGVGAQAIGMSPCGHCTIMFQGSKGTTLAMSTEHGAWEKTKRIKDWYHIYGRITYPGTIAWIEWIAPFLTTSSTALNSYHFFHMNCRSLKLASPKTGAKMSK